MCIMYLDYVNILEMFRISYLSEEYIPIYHVQRRVNYPSLRLRVKVKLDVPTFAPFKRAKGTLLSG